MPPASRDAVDRAANQYIRKNREHEHGGQRLSQVKPAQDKVLIDRVHQERKDDDPAYSFQSFAKVGGPLGWIEQDGLHVRCTAGPRVFQSVENGQDNRHDGLECAEQVRHPKPKENYDYE